MKESYKTGGYPAGSRILCSDGLLPVEFIEIGDRVVTRDVGMACVTDINRKLIKSQLVKFTQHALGETSPAREILLPINQMILIRDWRAKEMFGMDRALVEAGSLIDDIFIKMTEPQEKVIFQISLMLPHILYLEGTEVGSADAHRARGEIFKRH